MPKRVEASPEATFTTDDKKQAHYARLVVFNYGVKETLINKDRDVNSASNGELQKAYKSLVSGTLLEGPGGIEMISELTKKGAEDENVAKRGLTKAYAQEVRPFLKRGLLSSFFGRRARTVSEKPEKPQDKKPAAARKAAPKKRGATKRASAKKSVPQETPAVSEAPASA